MRRNSMKTVRSRELSLWQSAVYEQCRSLYAYRDPELARKEAHNHPMLQGASLHVQAAHEQEPLVPLLADEALQVENVDHQAYLSKVFYEYAQSVLRDDKDADKRLEEKIRKFSAEDLKGWKSCLDVYWRYYRSWKGWKEPEYRDWTRQGDNNPTYGVIPWSLSNEARVGIIGDWGTGLEDARALVRQMITQLDVDVIIHIGDIYYSGTPLECQYHVYELFRSVFDELRMDPIPVFTIPGNHDYYARGEGYYQLIDELNRYTGSGQEASYFSLQTKDGHWQLLAADTGLEDRNPLDQGNPLAEGPGLIESEVRWHVDKLRHFQGSTVLLTHHQLFSHKAKINGTGTDRDYFINQKLLHTFQPFFDRIAGWIWGHEHSYAMYQNGLLGLARGRLVGNGGYEILEKEDPYQVAAPGLPMSTSMEPLSVVDGYFNHGCALLDFKRNHPKDPIKVSYFQFPSWGDEAPENPKLEHLNTEEWKKEVSRYWNSQEVLTKIGSPMVNDSIQMVPFDDSLLTVYKPKGSREFVWAKRTADGTWRGNQKIADSSSIAPASTSSPSLALFQDKVFMAYKAGNTTDLHFAMFDGNTWQGDQEIAIDGRPLASKEQPALIAFRGKLWMVYLGANKEFHVAWFDGESWTGGQPISKLSDLQPKSCYAPGLVVYRDKLTFFYRGILRQDLYWMTFDGDRWEGNEIIADPAPHGSPKSKAFGLSSPYNPQPAVFDQRLYLLYRGAQLKNLYWACYDGEEDVWSGNLRIRYSSPIAPYSVFQPALASTGKELVGLYPDFSSSILTEILFGTPRSGITS